MLPVKQNDQQSCTLFSRCLKASAKHSTFTCSVHAQWVQPVKVRIFSPSNPGTLSSESEPTSLRGLWVLVTDDTGFATLQLSSLSSSSTIRSIQRWVLRKSHSIMALVRPRVSSSYAMRPLSGPIFPVDEGSMIESFVFSYGCCYAGYQCCPCICFTCL